jgi:hypothetical protein
VRKVAGRIALCSYTERAVADALKAAAPNGIGDTWDSATLNVVARCGTGEKVFAFPYPAEVDLKALHRDSPRVDALWDLSYKVRRHAFGKHFSFRDSPPAQEKEFEDLGMKLLPELVSGKYDAGFGDTPAEIRNVIPTTWPNGLEDTRCLPQIAIPPPSSSSMRPPYTL